MMDWRKFPHLVALAARDPAYAAALAGEMVEVTPGPTAETTPLPTVAETRADIRRIMACESWERPSCGCAQGLCTFPWRRRLVTFDDCRSCLGIDRAD